MPKPIGAALGARTVRSRLTNLETRAATGVNNDADLTISGYMVVFDQPYYIDELHEEIVTRHAFDEADMSDVRALCDHLTHLVLGRSVAGTLEYTIDDVGIFVTIRVNPADQDALNLYARVQRGDVNQASFGFDEDGEAGTVVEMAGGRTRWEIRRITKLWEFSVCTFPAYEQTSVEARARQMDDLVAKIHRQQAEAERAAQLSAAKAALRRRLRHARR